MAEDLLSSKLRMVVIRGEFFFFWLSSIFQNIRILNIFLESFVSDPFVEAA